MVDYLSYLTAVQSPVDALAQGYSQGLSLRNTQEQMEMRKQQQILAQQQAERAMQSKMERQQNIANFVQKKGKTAEDYVNLGLLYPDIAEGARKGFELLNKDQQQNALRSGSQIFAAYQNEKPEIANQLLEERANAFEQQGNQRMAAYYRSLNEMPDNVAQASIGSSLATLDPNFAKSFSIFQEDKRAEELQPLEVKAKRQSIVNAGIDAGLKKAQINKTMAQTRNIGLNGQKIAVEIEGIKNKNNGIIPSEDKIKLSTDLRKDYVSNAKEYTKAIDQLSSLESIFDNLKGRPLNEIGPADVLGIVNFIKINDPTSTVTSTEGGQIQGSSSIYQGLISRYNKAFASGGILTNNIRNGMLSSARKLVKPKIEKLNSLNKEYSRIASNAGLNPQDILVTDFRPSALQEEQRGKTIDQVTTEDLDKAGVRGNSLLGTPEQLEQVYKDTNKPDINILLDKYAPQ